MEHNSSLKYRISFPPYHPTRLPLDPWDVGTRTSSVDVRPLEQKLSPSFLQKPAFRSILISVDPKLFVMTEQTAAVFRACRSSWPW